jgi:dihydropteroate synthase
VDSPARPACPPPERSAFQPVPSERAESPSKLHDGTAFSDSSIVAGLGGFELPIVAPRIMGIVNVTPDSFSDAGLYASAEAAIAHGRRLHAEGADILDVGGESTRPGAETVDPATEIERVLPVIEALSMLPIPVSIDTRKAAVAKRAVEAGASWINDVSGGVHDPEMLRAAAALDVPYVAMHTLGDPDTMQDDPEYQDPVGEVLESLRLRGRACLDAGIRLENLILDPGIGFGKRLEHNLALLRRLPELRGLGCPLVLGVSRKSFIGHLTGAEEQDDWLAEDRHDRPKDRIGGTVAAGLACVQRGAEVIRVHDVRIMHEALVVARALRVPDKDLQAS